MPDPGWTEEAKTAMGSAFGEKPSEGVTTGTGVTPMKFEPIVCFSTHFAEFSTRQGDILIHFFPRAGAVDEWYPGHYLPNCKNCGCPVPRGQPKCPKCGFYGRTYICGRLEKKGSTSFPEGTREAILSVLDQFWGGDVAIKYTEELDSYVVQLQKAERPLSTFGLPHMVTKICEKLDEWMDNVRQG